MRALLFIFLGLIGLIFGLSFRENIHEVNLTDNEYKVMTVQGRIVFEQSGKDMQRGDVYVTGTPLDFTTASSRAAIINEVNGRYVISASKGKLRMLPAANNVTSRGGAILNIVDLKNHFAGRYLVIKRGEVQVGQDAFPMNESNFFYVTYMHDGESIPKKLRSEGDYLILDAAEIYMIDGVAIPVTEKEMTLYHKGEKTLKISTFTPVFADANQLKEEVNMLLETLQKESTTKKIEEVTAYLNEFYGSPNKDNLAGWLKAEFNLE